MRDLRQFGLLVGGILAGIGILLALRGRGWYPLFLGAGTLLILLGLVMPRALQYMHRAWMTLAILLGWVMTRVVLAVAFFCIITPLGLMLRLMGKDLLALKKKQGADTFWIPRQEAEPPAARMEKQY